MLSKILSAATLGLNTTIVEVETDMRSGFPAFTIVGLPDAAVQEARERIKSAIKNAGLQFPYTYRITVNLAPATLRKEGPTYDLPIAVGLLMNVYTIAITDYKTMLFAGELALDGTLRATRGILPLVLGAREHGIRTLFIPEANAREAAVVEGITIIPVPSLSALLDHLSGKNALPSHKHQPLPQNIARTCATDFSLIHGQETAKRALEIAAAGGHNVLMSGPPGSGKTMLAKAMASILPNMTQQEILETTQLYSLAGLTTPEKPFILERPFRAPHHSASASALLGGSRSLRPGEISLAHRGVLFLDEFPEFSRDALEILRQPLEEGSITIARSLGSATFPARFTLIASQNPCPCGFASDPDHPCVCTPTQIMRYGKKISGPLLDRIDLHIAVPRVSIASLPQQTHAQAESSDTIRKRVETARAIQAKRLKKTNSLTNSELSSTNVRRYCLLQPEAQKVLTTAAEKMRLSLRGYFRVQKVARTIADLADIEVINEEHILEALHYRTQETH